MSDVGPITSDRALRRFPPELGSKLTCVDCREMCGCNLVTPRLIGGDRRKPIFSIVLKALTAIGQRGPTLVLIYNSDLRDRSTASRFIGGCRG